MTALEDRIAKLQEEEQLAIQAECEREQDREENRTIALGEKLHQLEETLGIEAEIEDGSIQLEVSRIDEDEAEGDMIGVQASFFFGGDYPAFSIEMSFIENGFFDEQNEYSFNLAHEHHETGIRFAGGSLEFFEQAEIREIFDGRLLAMSKGVKA